MEKQIDQLRTLIRENVLPRLDNHEAEIHELREVTWPVCQGQRDTAAGGVFTNIKAKRLFFKFMNPVDILRLLRRKAAVMGMCPSLAYEELRQIRVEGPQWDVEAAQFAHQ
jgi:hypothetical protein